MNIRNAVAARIAQSISVTKPKICLRATFIGSGLESEFNRNLNVGPIQLATDNYGRLAVSAPLK
jgi:hypothetical protein